LIRFELLYFKTLYKRNVLDQPVFILRSCAGARLSKNLDFEFMILSNGEVMITNLGS